MPEESTTPDLVELTRQLFEVATRGRLAHRAPLLPRGRGRWQSGV